MKFIITKEEIDLIPPVVRRRMTERDFDILDDVIHNNKRYYVAQDFNRYLEGNLRDSLNEFIHDYKLEEINQDLDYDDLDDEEIIKYKIFWQLIPFLEKKYHDLLYDYHMEYHGRSGNINESSDNKKKHLYRRIGEIEDVFNDNEFEDLFIRTAKDLNKDGFVHATSMFIGDILAGRLEEKGVDFDYVTLRNQIKRFVQSHFYQELVDFYNKHKKQLTESQDERLFNDLPNSLKRRLTTDDFDYLELIIDSKYKLRGYYLSGNFENYFNSVISDSIDTFVVNYKFPRYEGGTDLDDYNADRRKVISLFQGLIPFLKEKYRDKLYQFYRDL
jgi:hypothetical protein